ncbi:hypothetical protein [Dokdonella sp.]|uniref:hypothetical protein n=1 Tax=Dokdonella sp. TaxID=2291710 RepID=UPI003527E4B7
MNDINIIIFILMFTLMLSNIAKHTSNLFQFLNVSSNSTIAHQLQEITCEGVGFASTHKTIKPEEIQEDDGEL